MTRSCPYVPSRKILGFRRLCVEYPRRGTTRSKACVCGRSLAGIASSNPAGGMDVCLLCVVRYRSLQRADPSSRGVLPSGSCLTVRDFETIRRYRPLEGSWVTKKKKLNKAFIQGGPKVFICLAFHLYSTQNTESRDG
jgi:hypothetical protein